MPDPSDRSALIDVAELLFARDGVHGVSLRELTRAAGVRNKSAVQYHFDDRDGLLRAVLARRGEALRLRRAVAFEQLVVDGVDHETRPVCRAIVEPYCELLDQGIGALSYAVIVREIFNNPRYRYEELPGLVGEQLLPELFRRLLHPLDLPETLRHERLLAAISTLIGSVADRARRQLDDASHQPAGSVALFTSNLVDMLGAGITAPAHPDTLAEDPVALAEARVSG